MPRSSRHKSHKQSKHKEHSDSEEDVRMKYINGKDEFSVRISRDPGSSEKRKVSSGKDASGHGNGDSMQEYSALKRKREKTDSGAATDRWNSGGVDRQDSITMDKEVKGDISRGDADKNSRSKVSSDLRSKSTRKHESANEKKEEIAVTVPEKEEGKIGNKVDLKRKSDKDQGRKEAQQNKEFKESKDRDRGSERKVDSKRDLDVRGVVTEVSTKQGSISIDLNGERQTKRGKENADLAIQDDFRNPELEKELEKRIRRRSDSSREKHQDDVKDSESRRLSSKSDHSKNGKHKDGSHGDKHLEDADKESRYREDKYHEDHERDKRNKDGKYRDDGEKDQRHRDSKYREDAGRESRHKDDKYRDSGHRDSRHEDNNHREDGDKGRKRREDKYLEDDNVDNRYRDDKHYENSNGESKEKDDKYHENKERDDRRRNDKYREDVNRDGRHKEERHREDVDKDIKHKDGKQRNDSDRVKRVRDSKYRDEHLLDGSNDKSDVKRVKNDSNASESHKKSTNEDVYNTRDKDDKERRRGTDKDHSDIRSINSKDQASDADKKYVVGARIDTVSDQGKSSSRNADVESSPSRSRRRHPSNSGAASKIQSRTSIQEDAYEERSWNKLSSKKEFGGAVENASISRSNERSINKDDLHYRELSVERRQKLDSRSSPLQLADKSPSSASTERRHFSRSDTRRSLDIDDSGQRSGGSKDAKDYPSKEGRGGRDLTMETFPVNDDNLSVSSSFTRSNHMSLLPPPPFRNGSDNHTVIGSMEEDSRGKYYNRHRRVGDSSMARGGAQQGNAWKGIQSWASPVANGFMPFQHGPAAPVGFHPMIQQFPGPPIFGIRPPMELNHSSYGRPPLVWRNPMDDSCPATPHVWDGNNAIFRDESHIYGRLGWDQNRAIAAGVQSWDTRQEAWKATVEMPSLVPQRDDENNIHGPSDEVSAAKSAVQTEKTENDQNLQNVISVDVSVTQPISVEKENILAPKISSEEMQKQTEISKKDDVFHQISYLSKLDISVDLAVPDIYYSCMNFKEKDMDEDTNSDKDVSVILFLEGSKRNRNKSYGQTSKSLPIPAINEAIFQKALSVYGKHTEGWMGLADKEVQTNNHVHDVKMTGSEEEDKPAEAEDPIQFPENKGKIESSASPSSSLHNEGDNDGMVVVLAEDVVTMDIAEGAAEAEAIADMDIDDLVLTMKNDVDDDVVRTEEEVDDTSASNNKDEDVDDPAGERRKGVMEDCNHPLLVGGECGGTSLILSDDDDVILAVPPPPPPSDSDDGGGGGGSGSVNLSPRIHQSSESTH